MNAIKFTISQPINSKNITSIKSSVLDNDGNDNETISCKALNTPSHQALIQDVKAMFPNYGEFFLSCVLEVKYSFFQQKKKKT